MSQNQPAVARRPDSLLRVAGTVAIVVGLGLFIGVGWMVWYGFQTDMVLGYVFFGLLPFLIGLAVVLGGRRMWQGKPAGAAVARSALWIPLTLFVGGLTSSPFVADPEDKVPFMIFFGAVAAVLAAIVWLLTTAEKRAYASKA